MFSPRKNKKHIFFAKIISDPIWACLALHSLNLIPLKVHFSFKFASVPAWGSRNFSNIIQIFSRDIHTYFKGLQWNCMISKGNVYQLKFFVAPKLDKVSKSSNSILRPLNRKSILFSLSKPDNFYRSPILVGGRLGGWVGGGWWCRARKFDWSFGCHQDMTLHQENIITNVLIITRYGYMPTRLLIQEDIWQLGEEQHKYKYVNTQIQIQVVTRRHVATGRGATQTENWKEVSGSWYLLESNWGKKQPRNPSVEYLRSIPICLLFWKFLSVKACVGLGVPIPP